MPDGQLDPTSRATFARSIEALHEEFRGTYSLETIERFVDESIDRLSGARVVDFIPLFVHRFARERLRSLQRFGQVGHAQLLGREELHDAPAQRIAQRPGQLHRQRFRSGQGGGGRNCGSHLDQDSLITRREQADGRRTLPGRSLLQGVVGR